MGSKGNNTKRMIRNEAYKLFCSRGYKDVTMKDICDKTGLSRGGLYRHYDSTRQIFLEIISEFSEHQKNEFSEQIKQNIPAAQILNEILFKYANEMADSENSLSLAIYEFYSDQELSEEGNSVAMQYEQSKSMWIELINYGMQTKEFKTVNPEAVFDMIVFSYQGVRMYSRLMKIDSSIPTGITTEIKKLLIQEET